MEINIFSLYIRLNVFVIFLLFFELEIYNISLTRLNQLFFAMLDHFLDFVIFINVLFEISQS